MLSCPAKKEQRSCKRQALEPRGNSSVALGTVSIYPNLFFNHGKNLIEQKEKGRKEKVATPLDLPFWYFPLLIKLLQGQLKFLQLYPKSHRSTKISFQMVHHFLIIQPWGGEGEKRCPRDFAKSKSRIQTLLGGGGISGSMIEIPPLHDTPCSLLTKTV